MTETTAPPPKMRSTRGGVRGVVAAHPTVATVGLYAVAAIAAAVAAYLAIFTQFAAYDDEGTLLVTLKAFTHGEVLYRNIYTEYGPFYYELFGGLFALSGHAVTTDASRSIVIVVWVATSLLVGLAAQRLTGLLMLGVTAMVAAFGALGILASEPMHPHGLCVLLLAAFALVAVFSPGRRIAPLGAVCGALLAALVLTKVNLGLFALAAVALAAVLTAEPLYRRRWLRWPVIAAFLAMPFFILGRDLSESWVRDLALLEILGATAILVTAWPVRPQRGVDDAALSRWLLAAAAGFVAAFVAIVGIILLTGPTPADVYEGVIADALRVRDVFVAPFPLSSATVDWGIAAVAGAVLTTRLRGGKVGAPTIWPGLLRGAAGLTIWFSVSHLTPFTVNPSVGNPDALPLLLAWVAAIPPAGVLESAHKRFLRVLLPALAVAETLSVYPVAGSQMGIAALIYVPVGALCLGDAIVCLRAWGKARGPLALDRLGVVVGVVTIALAAEFALDVIARPAASNAVLYRRQPTLGLPGASLLHLPPADVETYAGVVDLLHRYRCTAFAGYPSINSLYLWSGIEGPPPQIPDAWMDAFDSARQQGIVDELRASPRPCAIRSDPRAGGWLEGKPPPQRPLVRYIFDDFKPAAEVGDIQFLVSKAPAPVSSLRSR